MFTRSSKWNVKSVILVALIGIIMGVIYTYGFNNVYNLVKLSFFDTKISDLVDFFDTKHGFNPKYLKTCKNRDFMLN